MTMHRTLLAALLAAALSPAFAQQGADAAARSPEHRVSAPRLLMHGAPLNVHAGGKLVKNAPYSAEIVTERTQLLADGNQISHTSTATSYRDSSGRTRHETRDANGELRLVTIHDPNEHLTWVLNPKDKTATRLGRIDRAELDALRASAQAQAATGRAAGEAARAQVEQLRREGKLPVVEHRSGAQGEEIVIRRVQRPEGGAGEARVQLAPALANAFGDARWSAKPTVKDLGSRDIEGVKAQGKLRSYEIPAGAIGNRNPIVVSDETWQAADLQVTLYARHSDPRSGDTVYRLQHLKREEPAAALFSVPADYTVKEPLAQLKRKAEEKAQ